MSPPIPSGRELEILKILWEIGPATVREVYEHMCPNGELHFNTVQTILRIMDRKGLVRHRTRGRTFVYSPKYNRDRETARLLNHLFDGALDQVVLSLLRTKDVTPQELKQLEGLIAEARRRRQKGPQKKED